MQDFDALRSRVEATARKLTSVQTERHDQTQSLIEILRHLEERHAAQEQQLAYYRDRVVPLEEANQHLVQLIEHLLELIDRGFGEESLGPLRNAAQMASAMLANDLMIEERNGTSHTDVEPHAMSLPDFGESDDDDARDNGPEEPEYGAGAVTDLQMEEDALISLDDLLEMASGEETSAQFQSAGDAIPRQAAAFEDVSAAVLQNEAREEAAAGMDHLPGIVKQAMAAATGNPLAAPQEPMPAFDRAMESAAGMAADSVAHGNEVEALSKIAEALEAETGTGNAPVPAPSDIRALLMRVEALARKAEAMRVAQGGDPAGRAKSDTATTGKPEAGKTGAAA